MDTPRQQASEAAIMKSANADPHVAFLKRLIAFVLSISNTPCAVLVGLVLAVHARKKDESGVVDVPLVERLLVEANHHLVAVMAIIALVPLLTVFSLVGKHDTRIGPKVSGDEQKLQLALYWQRTFRWALITMAVSFLIFAGLVAFLFVNDPKAKFLKTQQDLRQLRSDVITMTADLRNYSSNNVEQISDSSVPIAKRLLNECDDLSTRDYLAASERIMIEMLRLDLFIVMGDQRGALSTIGKLNGLVALSDDRDKLNMARIRYDERFETGEIKGLGYALHDPYLGIPELVQDMQRKGENNEVATMLRQDLPYLDDIKRLGHSRFRFEQVAKVWLDLAIALDLNHYAESTYYPEIVTAANNAMDRAATAMGLTDRVEEQEEMTLVDAYARCLRGRQLCRNNATLAAGRKDVLDAENELRQLIDQHGIGSLEGIFQYFDMILKDIH